MSTFTRSQDFVVVNCGPKSSGGCGLKFAMTREFYDETKNTGRGWFCPAGHSRRWTGPTLEYQLEQAQAQLTASQDQLRAAVHEAEEVRRALLRDRHRFANGVCPCCNRSFENVARHIQGQHPEYDVTKLGTDRGIRYRCSCGCTFATPRGLAIHQGHQRREGWDEPNAGRWRAHLTVVGS